MHFKTLRLGPLVRHRAQRGELSGQTHVIFGGTGAVGGATAVHLIRLLEEAAAAQPGSPDAEPRLLVTGLTKQEVRQFTSLLFGLQERDHGAHPEHLPDLGYRTVGGVVVELTTFGVDPSIPELSGFASKKDSDRRRALAAFLAAGDLTPEHPLEDKIALLERAIEERVGHPFGDFLRRYLDTRGLPGAQDRFRSVVVGIPLASVATYKLSDLEEAAAGMGLARDSDRLEELKAAYLQAIRDDLAHVASELSHEVLAAHTTAVGGMYDELDGGRRVIRLGFAHSALGDKLREKQVFAERLAALYAERGIRMLITAAAIGIDTVQIHKSPPMNGAIRRKLARAEAEGSTVVPAEHRSGGLEIYEPLDVDLLAPSEEPARFDGGKPLVLPYVVKSGENGFFTVSNADALYRVMRVTSSSELGLVLARVALLGDDPNRPFFRDNVCYYTETDNSRQVFDLVYQPPLLADQLSGLSPKALQDLGSAKHQAELHTLGLLILLHRLQTLDLDAIPMEVDLAAFDPRAFFDTHSQELTLDRILGWTVDGLERGLKTLVTAREPDDLAPLKHFFQPDPDRQEAAHRVLDEVLDAVRAIPSLGSPILYRHDGRARVRMGYYAAPLDLVVRREDSIATALRQTFEALGGGSEEELRRFVDFQVTNHGFVDLRPEATLVTTRMAREGLEGKVRRCEDREAFVRALEELEPYSYFTTSGLLALLVRLQGLAKEARKLDLSFGSANDWRAHVPRDHRNRPLLVPGVVEAFRMVSEGLEKNTGTERLDGPWGYAGIPSGSRSEKN